MTNEPHTVTNMNLRVLIPLALLTSLAFAPTMTAEHGCWRYVGPGCLCPDYPEATPVANSTIEYGVYYDAPGRIYFMATAGTTFYVVTDEIAGRAYLLSAWIYEESNGKPGLQRHDDYCYTRDTTSDAEADRIVF